MTDTTLVRCLTFLRLSDEYTAYKTAKNSSERFSTIHIALLRVLVIGLVAFFTLSFLLVLLVSRFNQNYAPAPFVKDATMYFIVVGDWGRNGTMNQLEVANAMGSWCTTRAITNNGKCHLIVSTGDNFYDNGVHNVHAKQFNDSFEGIYTHSGLLNTPWYLVNGNHDWRGDPHAQIEYSKYSKRWIFPDYYHSFIIPNLVQFIFIDTTPFLSDYRTNPKMNTKLLEQQNTEKQLIWFKEQVKKGEDAKVLWKLAVGHHPMYSAAGKHGDIPEMISNFEKLMSEEGVHMYWSGHDHNLQHLRNDTARYFNGKLRLPLEHVISGAGSETRDDIEEHPLLKAKQIGSGFVFVKIEREVLTFSFVDYNGQETFTNTIKLW